ncbi:hypothetical protein F4212_04690, partial [Candidatus Poribacteria bacterium]|nr:hypothetical protein [Candidatus Poribacteria bacterium]
MYRTVFIIIIVTLCTNHLCFAEDITLEELIRGTNKARMTIKSGEIHTELTEENAAEKTEEEIDAYIQEEIEKELKSYVPHDGVDKETLKNDYLIPNFKYNANRFRKHTVVE